MRSIRLVRTHLELFLLAVFGLLFARDLFAIQSDLPLDQAARDGNLSEVERLLNLGADANDLDKWGLTALTGASGIGAESRTHTEIVRRLIAHGADVNRRVAMGTTALNEAAFAGNESTARVLIEAGANPNAAKNNGWTPLHSAASRGSIEIVRLLLQHGADPSSRNDHGQTPLDLASRFGHQQVANLIAATAEQSNSDKAATNEAAVNSQPSGKSDSVLDKTRAKLQADAQAQLRKDYPGIEFNDDGSIASPAPITSSHTANSPSAKESNVIIIGDPNAPNRLPEEKQLEVSRQGEKSSERRVGGIGGSMQDGYKPLDYVLSFLVTWLVVLVPPIVIRGIRRGPLTKGWAIAVCIGFWFINFSVFVALGSTSKTHAALILGAYFSYLILRNASWPRHSVKAPL